MKTLFSIPEQLITYHITRQQFNDMARSLATQKIRRNTYPLATKTPLKAFDCHCIAHVVYVANKRTIYSMQIAGTTQK